MQEILLRRRPRYRHNFVLERHATYASENDEGAHGSSISSSRTQASTITRTFSLSYFPYRVLVLHDLELYAYVVHASSESDDSSDAESDGSSIARYLRITRPLCVCGCGKWAWLEWHGRIVTYYNGMCFQDEETQINSGWLNWRMSAISCTRRPALQRLIQLENIYIIVESFFIGDLFSMCCHESCGSCIQTWFLRGWVCPHYWI